jgi:hypothetical protein
MVRPVRGASAGHHDGEPPDGPVTIVAVSPVVMTPLSGSPLAVRKMPLPKPGAGLLGGDLAQARPQIGHLTAIDQVYGSMRLTCPWRSG